MKALKSLDNTCSELDIKSLKKGLGVCLEMEEKGSWLSVSAWLVSLQCVSLSMSSVFF